MTEADIRGVGSLPSPAAALVARFTTILNTRMAGVAMVNPVLDVRAVGFRAWGEHWLGVLSTPWFMNLVLMPRVPAHWEPVRERETRHFVFPAGVFEFIGAHDADLGNYLACSLFSPMQDFADAAAAQATAQAALDALFDGTSRDAAQADVTAGTPFLPAADAPAAASVAATGACPPALSKRAFLFGKPMGPGGGA